ncbi:MAG: LCP family protein [Chloroflexi bacterium]|nr:LCP family protein [Chloroflexota bacterium]
MIHSQAHRPKTPHRHNRLTLTLAVAFTVVGIATAVLAFIVVRNAVASWSMTGGLPGLNIKSNDGTTNAQGTPNIPSIGPLQPVGGPTPQPWDGKSRVNVLLMGLDYRDWLNNDIPRTDSMWLLTIDPVSMTAGMLSIPRDTWVAIPGFDYYKINTAYFLGEANHLPGGGPALAIKTVEDFLGVPINFYAQIDFQAFVDFIDAIDGVLINVPEEIKVDPLGPGNTVILQPGEQRLYGAVALGYARNRYTEGNDFDRSERQAQVILAVRNRVLKVNILPLLIAKAPELYQKLSAGIHTNLNLDQAIQLAWLAQKIPPEKITKEVIGPNEVINGTSPDGLSIEIPIPDRSACWSIKVFTSGGSLGPAATVAGSDPQSLAKAENARISVQNGTSTDGIATRTSDYLKSLGLNVLEPSNADQLYSETTIIDYTGKPYTVAYLVKEMHINPNRVLNRYDPNAQLDVAVIAGQDWVANNPMP